MAQSSEPRRIHKPTIVLLLLILAAFGLMVVQLRSPAQVSTAGQWTVAVFTPLFEAGTWSADKLQGLLKWAISSQAALSSNRQLRRENADLKVQVNLLGERIAKLERERELRRSPLPDIGMVYHYANVVGLSSQRWVHSIVVDQGKIDGVRPAMPAIDYSGAVVGMVVEAAPNSAVVLLLTDPNLSIGAMIADSRERGLVTGLGEAKGLLFRPDEPQKQLRTGVMVVSSGFKGSVYPKGLPIGRISQVTQDKYAMQYAEIEPAAKFDSLEEVILIDTEPASRASKDRPATSRPAAASTDRSPAGPKDAGVPAGAPAEEVSNAPQLGTPETGGGSFEPDPQSP